MMIVLVLLAAVWAVVGYMWWRERSGGRVDATLDFRRQLSTLERRIGPRGRSRGANFGRASFAGPVARPIGERPPGMPARSEVRKRRRDVFYTLLALCALTLVLAAGLRSPVAIGAFVVTLAMLGTYVYLLVQVQRLAAERRSKVHYLEPKRRSAPRPAESTGETPALFLGRSATN